MKKDWEIRYENQLGMSHGLASNRLKKILLFELAKKLNYNICYRCGEEIKSSDGLSMDHKIPWIHSVNPVELFFDINNVAFSHLKCNISHKRTPKKYFTDEERKAARKRWSKESYLRTYDPAKRREKYLRERNRKKG